MPDGLSLEDGAATLTEMTAAAVAAATRHFPEPAREWLVTGGGRHNPALMAALRRRLGVPVRPVEAVGWDGDALEAQAFAYLAVRSVEGLPLSLPSTTGVPRPTCGGRLLRAPLPHRGRGRPRVGWAGEGQRSVEMTLTRLAVLGTLSCGAGEGLRCGLGNCRVGGQRTRASRQWVTRRRSMAAALIAFCSFSKARTSI